MPDLTKIKPEPYERYFLYNANGIELRIQKVGDRYEFERKTELSSLAREELKFAITQGEFNALKKYSQKALFRENYLLSKNPEISLKIYQGDYQRLVRVEVEFKSEQKAQAFKPLTWFGAEITGTPLGRDKTLIALSKNQFTNLLKKFSLA